MTRSDGSAEQPVGAPAARADPDAPLRAVEAQLDAVHDRVARTASTGRSAVRQHRRIVHDLQRAAADLSRLAPGTSVVRARVLTERLAAYRTALGAVSMPAAPLRRLPLVVAGLVIWSTVVLHLRFTVVVLAALAAVTGTRAALRWRRRWVGRRRFGPVLQTLDRIDAQAAGPAGIDVGRLDRDRHALVQRARASGRLDTRGLSALCRIDDDLDDLLLRLLADDLGAHSSYLVSATVTSYLPDTLEPFLAMDADASVAGRPAWAEVADQLEAIAVGLAEARQSASLGGPQTRLQVQGEFLREKFSAGS